MTYAPTCQSSLADVQGLLPEVALTLVALIGLADTAELVRQAGGTTFSVPQRKTRQGEAKYEALAEMIGSDAATLMVRHFGGESLYIPRCHAALLECIYREIRRSFDIMTREMPAIRAVASLAVRYKYTDRHVWSILKMPDRIGDAESAVRSAAQLGLF